MTNPSLVDKVKMGSVVADCEYDDQWFLTCGSDYEDLILLRLRWYLDDSRSDDGSRLVTCGGLAMSRIQYKAFCAGWSEMYSRNQFAGFTLEPPLHMTDFAGYGKYAALPSEFKRTLFRDVARLINAHKLYGISISVSQSDFVSELSADVRKTLIGPYGFAFFALVLAHKFLSARHRQGPFKAAYMVDCGFAHYDQLVAAHRVIVGFEEAFEQNRHTGPLSEDSDSVVPGLQAADAVAWASRKRQLIGSLPEGFEPLSEAIAEEKLHVTIPINRDGIRTLAQPINNWISRNGMTPKLTDIMVQRLAGGLVARLK